MKNEALNLLTVLLNTGAEFEDEDLALDIIEANLEGAVKTKLEGAAENANIMVHENGKYIATTKVAGYEIKYGKILRTFSVSKESITNTPLD